MKSIKICYRRGFDDKILALYVRGMTTRDIQAQLQDHYSVEVSPTLISNVTEAVIDEVRKFQARLLEAVYLIVYFDCLVVKVRENQRALNKALHLALGVNLSGYKELLGCGWRRHEEVKFWLGVLTELQNRGVKEVFMAWVDGLTGLPEAIEAVYPQARVQLWQVASGAPFAALRLLQAHEGGDNRSQSHLLRSTGGKAELVAELQLDFFAEKWDPHYPSISKFSRSHWARVIPLIALPGEIRKVISTTNAIESLNMTLRKVTRNHRIFPSDEAVYKVVYLAMRKLAKKRTMPIRDWKPALNRLAVEFAERFPE